MKKNFTLLCFVLLVTLPAFSQTKTLRYDTPMGVNINGFYEYLPKSYNTDPNKKFPLLIYMHGLGVIGDGSRGILEYVVTSGWGTPPWRTWNTTTFPTSFDVNGQQMEFILITPQFINEPWGTYDRDINNVIDYCTSHYKVDANKIYLAGQSSAGQFVMDFVGSSLANAKKIAGVLASSPAGGASQAKGNNISAGKVPVWIAVSEQDEMGGGFINSARAWINVINNATPAPKYVPKLSVLPGEHTHNDAAIYLYSPFTSEGGMNAYQWMLQFDKRTALPVTGLQLTARDLGKTILLQWSTQFESNNKGFTVQQSADGIHFNDLGFVNASGKSIGGEYEFEISNPLTGINYFRLEQQDMDGETSLSEIINVRFAAAGRLLVTPNPAHSMLTLNYNAGFDDADIRIFDANGKLRIEVNAGTTSQKQINVSGLAAGFYSGQIFFKNKKLSFTFIKK